MFFLIRFFFSRWWFVPQLLGQTGTSSLNFFPFRRLFFRFQQKKNKWKKITTKTGKIKETATEKLSFCGRPQEKKNSDRSSVIRSIIGSQSKLVKRDNNNNNNNNNNNPLPFPTTWPVYIRCFFLFGKIFISSLFSFRFLVLFFSIHFWGFLAIASVCVWVCVCV